MYCAATITSSMGTTQCFAINGYNITMGQSSDGFGPGYKTFLKCCRGKSCHYPANTIFRGDSILEFKEFAQPIEFGITKFRYAFPTIRATDGRAYTQQKDFFQWITFIFIRPVIFNCR
uniref:Uncharacterized protein n=1 Tax=Candidatus Kentrum eta TaxID=2126337 RepID=A0A450W122_9GAMM|nr:MAG: hypothetical protein BECKH772C_GA0070978_107351 [Candidatus Kentron sp. H]